MTDDDELKKDGEELDEEKEGEESDELVPLVISDDDVEGEDDSDESIASESFSPAEGAETPGEFDPEDPDAYLYNTPPVKYADSAEEDEEGVWNEEF